MKPGLPMILLLTVLACGKPAAGEQGDPIGKTAARLILAIESGDAQQVRQLLEGGLSADTRTADGDGVLLLAIKNRNHEIVRLLLKAGASPERNDPEKSFHDSPLVLAIEQEDANLASLLIQSGADVNAESMWTPLAAAVNKKSLPLIKLLLDKGADVNFIMSVHTSESPLSLAAGTGEIRIVSYLLERGADINPKTSLTPLQIAAQSGNLEIVRLLVQHGADLLGSGDRDAGNTALLFAINNNHKPVARFLLEEEQRRKRAQAAGSLAGAAAPDKDYLSSRWALHQYAHPGGRRDDLEAMEQAVRRAAELQRRGFQEYKKKNDREAVRLYEEALDHHATAGIYYNYANSLSNLPRLADALKAYQIALDLQHPEAFLVFYNMACAHARLKEREPALRYLKRAVAEGYAAFAYMEKDEDLAYLRALPEWAGWLAELKADAPGREVTQSGEEVFKRLYLNKRLSNRASNIELVFKATANTGEYGLGEYEISHIDESKLQDSGIRGENGSFRISGNTLHLLNSFSYMGFSRQLVFKPDGPRRVEINRVAYEVR